MHNQTKLHKIILNNKIDISINTHKYMCTVQYETLEMYEHRETSAHMCKVVKCIENSRFNKNSSELTITHNETVSEEFSLTE